MKTTNGRDESAERNLRGFSLPRFLANKTDERRQFAAYLKDGLLGCGLASLQGLRRLLCLLFCREVRLDLGGEGIPATYARREEVEAKQMTAHRSALKRFWHGAFYEGWCAGCD